MKTLIETTTGTISSQMILNYCGDYAGKFQDMEHFTDHGQRIADAIRAKGMVHYITEPLPGLITRCLTNTTISRNVQHPILDIRQYESEDCYHLGCWQVTWRGGTVKGHIYRKLPYGSKVYTTEEVLDIISRIQS